MSTTRVNRGRIRSVRTGARLVALALMFALAAIALTVPAKSAPQTQPVPMGNYYFGDGSITATVGDRLNFVVVAAGGNNHTVEITELGISSGKLDEGDTFLTPPLTAPGTYVIWCKTHKNQGHQATLTVDDPAPTTTTTGGPTTTTGGPTTSTSSTTTTTTTIPPGGTTTTPPGATTTSAPPTTTAGATSTTVAGSDAATTTVAGSTTGTTTGGPIAIPSRGDTEDGGSVAGGQPLGNGAGIQDAAWLRPLWWAILVGSLAGLVWVGLAWRRRPTEYD